MKGQRRNIKAQTMKLVATCPHIHEAQSIANRLKNAGIDTHILEEATAGMRVPRIPVTVNVMVVQDHQAAKAQMLIQSAFPNHRSAGIQLCERCSNQTIHMNAEIKRMSVMSELWIRFMAAFFFKSYCPNCRRLY